jgi:5-oxopent-3-ene-1,2,5-tricarboxylate decarboxylase/2-hydroxyhepta-2,4-diene-1,7-dioate isomerase
MLRPPIREKCRDGFLPIGPVIVPLQSVADLRNVVIRLAVDGKDAAEFRVERRFHSIGKVIEEASAFMTFRAGDVLLVTDSPTGPRARAGSSIWATADGIDRLECDLRNEEDLK